MPYKHCQPSFIHFYYLLLFLLSMQYTQLLLVPCPLAFVLCIMHTVYSFFVGLFILCVVFVCALFCIMYTRYDEQRGRGGCFVYSVRGVGEGGIEVGVRRRYPTSTPRAIFNSPGHSTLLTTLPPMWHNTITPISSFRVGI